jgi:hypothetical protein
LAVSKGCGTSATPENLSATKNKNMKIVLEVCKNMEEFSQRESREDRSIAFVQSGWSS